MANFYLCRTWVLKPVVEGVVQETGWVVGTEATLRYVMDDFQTTTHTGTTIDVHFPRRKYTMPITLCWADGDRAAVPPVLPTVALLRVDGVLENGDYNIDMTNRNAAQWANMYATYPLLAEHPFTDAPFQP